MKVVLQDAFTEIIQREVPGLPDVMEQRLVCALVNVVARQVKVANKLTLLRPHEAAESTVVEWHMMEMARDLGMFIAKQPGFCTTEITDDLFHRVAIRDDLDPSPGKEIRMSIRVLAADCIYRLVDPLRKFRTKP